MRLFTMLISAALFAGCARSDFQITRPEQLAMRIGEVPERVETPNMVYNMQAKENRLVVQIYNSRPEAVQLLGERSFVVDPQGQSHPLRSQSIAPTSYMKLILPPLRPRFEQSDPSWHFGVGTRIDDVRPVDPQQPLFLDVYSSSDSYYWDWDGELPIRLSLSYRAAGGKEFTDDFAIQKVPAK